MMFLQSASGDTYEVTFEQLKHSNTLANIYEDADGDTITIPDMFNANVLSQFVQFIREADPVKAEQPAPGPVPVPAPAQAPVNTAPPPPPPPKPPIIVPSWMEALDKDDLVTLLKFGDFLNADLFIDTLARAFANKFINGKSAQQIRDALGIKNDYTPEEEAIVRKENETTFLYA
jgi:S-phase kinase-associated protein 1